MSRLLLLTGVRGVGKTQLALEWLQQNKLKFLWFTAERFKDLPELLGHPDLDIEASLERATERCRDKEIVVWDDVHLLSPTARRSLFSFLRNAPFLPPQLFLSDEELPEAGAFALDLVQRRVQPFTSEDVASYVASIGEAADAAEIEALLKATGGIPLLLRLWAQGAELRDLQGAFQNRLIENLSTEETELLSLGSLLNRPFSLGDLTRAVPSLDLAATAASLQRKCLLESAPRLPDCRVVPEHVRTLAVKSLDAEAVRKLSHKLCSIYEGQERGMEFLFHALRAGSAEQLARALHSSLVDRLEHLLREDLKELADLLARDSAEKLPPEDRFLLIRLRLRAHLLLGERDRAIELGEVAVRRLEAEGLLQKEKAEFLVLELVQLLNRAGHGQRAREWSEKVSGGAKGGTSTPNHCGLFLQIEKAVSWMPAEPKRAQEILESVFLRLKASPATALATAQAHFQLARAHDLQEQRKRAEASYHEALSGFRAADKPYFAAVTLLNLAWLALKERDWPALSSLSAELSPLAARYGYQYVLAGIELIEATQARLSLQYGKALQKIEGTIKRLGAAAPLPARLDAHSEYVRILNAMGLRFEAETQLKALRALAGERKNPGFEKRHEALTLELRMPLSSTEDWLDRFEQAKSEDRELHTLFALQRGIGIAPGAPAAKTPILELAALELELTQALRGESDAELWPRIARMERLLERTPDALPERVALLLLQASLVTESSQQAHLLSRASVELKRWSHEPRLRAPFEAWIDGLTHGTAVIAHPAWRKCAPGDRERWRRWLPEQQKERRLPWIVITLNGKSESEAEPARDKSASLHVIEHLAAVSWKGKPLEEFVRRHSLRKLLSLLLEHAAEGADKQTIACVAWGESYNPSIHDPRIYTAIQRLRTLLRKQDCIQNWSGGYRWNPEYTFQLIRAQAQELAASAESRRQNLILQALEGFARSGRHWISRAELVELTKSSEATVKRELTKLLSSSLISRQGKGRAVVYSLRKRGS